VSDLERVVAALKTAPSVAVLTHIHPEGDAIGSALAATQALRESGKVVAAHVADPLTPGLATLPGADLLVREAPRGRGYACYLVLDTNGLDRTGGMLEGRPPTAIVVNVDHHPGNTRFGDVNWVDPEASSAGEMVYRILREGGFPISKATAADLYAAILTDTGSFHYGNTTPQALRAAAGLVECGAVPEMVAHGLYDHHAAGEWRLLSEALATLQVSRDGRLAWVEISLAAQARAGASLEVTEDFVQYPRSVGGVQMALAFKEVSPQEVKVSFRSRGALDVAALATQFGGGGHRNAAGCTLAGSLPILKAQILAAAQAHLSGQSSDAAGQ
jgi:phosphoesterase RecJ-like protein